MKIDVIEDKKNPFLERREMKIIVKQKDRTPSREEIEKEVSKIAKAKQENIDVKHIYQKVGRLETECIIDIYNKPVEKRRAKKKEKSGEEEKKEDIKTEEPNEKAKEAPKEESKAEEKKEVKEDGKETS